MRFRLVAAEVGALALAVTSAHASPALPGDLLPDAPPTSPPVTTIAPPSAAPAPLPAAVAPSPLVAIPSDVPAPSLTGVLVDVTGDARAELQRASPGSGWARVCSAPCRAVVPPDGFYRIGGPLLRPSSSFQVVAGPENRVELTVNTASKDGWTSGILLVALGGIGLVAGNVILSVAFLDEIPERILGGSAGPDAGLVAAAAGTLVAAAACAVGGVYMLVSNRHTTVQQAPFVRPSPPLGGGAWAPVTLGHDRDQALVAPIVAGAPIVSFAF